MKQSTFAKASAGTSTDYADYTDGSFGFRVGWAMASRSVLRGALIVPVPNHGMVAENSPGLQPWEVVTKDAPCKGDRRVSCVIPGNQLSTWASGYLLSMLKPAAGKNPLVQHTKHSAALTGRGRVLHVPRAKAPGYSIKPFHGLKLIALLTLFLLARSASGDPAQDNGRASPPPSPSPYAVINHIGEADQQVTWHEDKLLAHRRTNDPFGIAIRGKFKGLPPVEQHTLAATNLPAQAVKVATELTLEKAVLQLAIGAVNIADREALIGFRSVHEGDLLVLQLSGHRFVVWVESIDHRGVQFCDINLQHHALKPFRFGPTELPQNAAAGQTNVRDFLNQNGN